KRPSGPTMDERTDEATSSMVGVPFTGTLGRGERLSSNHYQPYTIVVQKGPIWAILNRDRHQLCYDECR
nr:hypothetical protein [Ktedonobacteraceae bacterium]